MTRRRWQHAAAAGFVVLAATFAQVGVQAVHAHGSAPHGNADASAAPTVSKHRWGAEYFPNVELTTQHGKTVRFYDDLLKGKVVGINVVFTECTEVCPLETANMAQLQRVLGDRYGKDIVFYSISIDPKRDTPAVLKAYADKFSANWTFLTGSAADVDLITRKLGLMRPRDLAKGGHHSATLMIGNERTGQWTRTSAVDNPRFLAGRIGSLLGWRDTEPQKSYADARAVVADNGQRLFQSKCSSCHTIGQPEKIGPDLLGVTARRERAWLTRYISAPDELLAAGDPAATALFEKYRKIRMPNLKLGASDVADLIAYLDSANRARTAASR